LQTTTRKTLRCAFAATTLCAIAVGHVSAATPTVIWNDEFNQADNSGPDSVKWGYDLGNNNGWGNNELESYTNSRENSYVASDAAAIDGKVDILWEEPTSGSHGTWLMNGTVVTGWVDLAIVPAPWHIVR
jgi:hypothetical protein